MSYQKPNRERKTIDIDDNSTVLKPAESEAHKIRRKSTQSVFCVCTQRRATTTTTNFYSYQITDNRVKQRKSTNTHTHTQPGLEQKKVLSNVAFVVRMRKGENMYGILSCTKGVNDHE